MIKPERLKPGDRVAIVSLSSGMIGDPMFYHKFELGKRRLEEDFGLEVVAMPHALMGSQFVYEHPELRAKDLMDAFRDQTIKAIICAIGGEDTIRLLPYIDYGVIRENPKIFMGYSDTTSNHFMLYKAGLVSFYGPTLMCEFGEYVSMFDYTVAAIRNILFSDSTGFNIQSSPVWSKDFIPWSETNMHRAKSLLPEARGYEVLQGTGKVRGHFLGGCLETFQMNVGTEIWPTIDQWRGALLLIETSEEKPEPVFLKRTLMNLAAQGIFRVIKGIVVGKPMHEHFYEEYKEIYRQVIAQEERLPNLPILYNVNIGHAMPIGIIPLGIEAELDCDEKTLTLLESATVDN